MYDIHFENVCYFMSHRHLAIKYYLTIVEANYQWLFKKSEYSIILTDF